MPITWTTHALIKISGAALVTVLLASSTATAAASWLLLDVEETAVVGLEVEPAETNAKSKRAAKRGRQLDAAMAKQAQKERRERLEEIVDHNVFCPSCKPADAAPVAPEADSAAPGAPLPLTDQPLALLATMESDDPQTSLATILDTERAVTGVFAVNDVIRPGVTLAGVARGAVTVRTSGALQALAFSSPETKKPKKKPNKTRKSKRRKKRSSREIEGAREAIDCEGHDCTVDRRFVNKLIANPAKLGRQARVVPAVKDGETKGFKLYRVRRGTLPNLLGLRNGDTLLSVNGTKLDSMDQAISLYTKLRRASNLSVTVERKGKVFEKHVAIR